MAMDGVNNSVVLKMNGILNYTNNIVCYQSSSISTNGMWQNQNPTNFSLPIFILQLIIIVGMTKLTIFILKPFQQPRFVCELLSGLLLGPSGFGAIDWIGKNIFPLKSLMVLESMGNIGVIYYVFLVGIEMDVTLIKQSSRQTITIAVISFFVPFTVYTSMIMLVHMIISSDMEVSTMNMIYQGVTISFTAFPVVSRILVELKLFNTELGQKAMSAALIVDLFAWSLVTVFVRGATFGDINFFMSILGTVGFVLLCFLTVRPIIMWIIKCTPEGENFNELYTCLILTAVLIFSFIGSIIGSPKTFGAFVIGLMIPNGPFGAVLLEKLEDFVTGILLPISFTTTSFRIDIAPLFSPAELHFTVIKCCILLLTNVSKVLSTFLMGLYYDMQMHEALSLGFLLNTKGFLNLIFIFMGLRTKVFDGIAFSLNMIFMILVMMFTTPAISALYTTSRQFISLNRMSIQMLRLSDELKILMCVHTPQNVSGMINLLEVSHANKESTIDVYAVHLVELTARASSMLIVHNAQKSHTSCNMEKENTTQSKHIIRTFEDYAKEKTNVNVQLLTAISPYLTMHEDICNLAEDKRVALIVLPFHKQQTVDGGMESTNTSLQQLSQNVSANAPCSVGIFIDRGLCRSASHVSHRHIAVIFIGGSDDREALAYGWRMLEHSGVKLTVLRLIQGADNTKPTAGQPHDEVTLKVIINTDKETQLDDECIGDFKLKAFDNKAIVYKEKVVNNAEETVSTILNMDDTYDLYIVGRGLGIDSPLTAGLNEFNESPELGAIGDLLASSDFARTVSILVMQHYVPEKIYGG